MSTAYLAARAPLGADRVSRADIFTARPSRLPVLKRVLFSCHRQAKIAVKAESEEELLILQATAKSLGICARSIQDAYAPPLLLALRRSAR